MKGTSKCATCGLLIDETIPGSGIWIHRATGWRVCRVEGPGLPTTARPAAAREVTPRFKLGLARTRKGRRQTQVPSSVAAAVRARSKGACEAHLPGCRIHAVHMHHVRRRSQSGGHTVENIRHVCLACHDEIHAHPVASRAMGLLSTGPARAEESA